MRLVTFLLLVSLCAGSVSSAESEPVQDTAKVQVVRDDGAKKQVSVPKPKTNWSKLKELFM